MERDSISTHFLSKVHSLYLRQNNSGDPISRWSHNNLPLHMTSSELYSLTFKIWIILKDVNPSIPMTFCSHETLWTPSLYQHFSNISKPKQTWIFFKSNFKVNVREYEPEIRFISLCTSVYLSVMWKLFWLQSTYLPLGVGRVVIDWIPWDCPWMLSKSRKYRI